MASAATAACASASGDPLPLAGPRVRLRRLAAADLPAFQAYRHDADVGRWQGWEPLADREAAAFLAEMAALPFCPAGAWCQIAIADAASDRLIGDIGLHLAADASCVEIGFTLARAAQGRGLAAEAVGLVLAAVCAHTPAQRLVAVTDVRNAASVRLLQRLGFHCVATRDAVFRGAACQEHHFERPHPGAPHPRPALG